MTTQNRTVLKQLEKTEFLVVSGKTQKPTVNDRLAKLELGTAGDGSGGALPAPDWNQLQEWGIAALENSAAEIKRTDRDHRKVRVRLSDARRDRDRKVERIAGGHRALRQSFTGTYGEPSLPLVGLDALPARRLVAVREQMREVVGRMRDPQLAAGLPEPLAGQKPIELETVADAREGEIGDLEVQMGEVDALRKQTDEALIVREEALARNRRVYSNVGRLLEGVYRLAGLDELADRIRATTRAPRKKSEPESSESESEPATAESSPEAQEGGDIDP